jgi:PAS domain S-box-containing protein
MVGVAPGTVTAWENDYQQPEGDNLVRLAETLGTTPSFIVTGSPSARHKPVRAAETTRKDLDVRETLDQISRIVEKARADLPPAAAQLEQFFRLSHDLFCILTPESRIVLANAAWGERLGYETDDLLGRPIDGLASSEHARPLTEGLSKLADGEGISDLEIQLHHTDGTKRWLSWNAASAGGLVYASARDVTERVEAEVALREGVRRYQNIFETAGVAIWEQDGSRMKRDIDEIVAQGVEDFKEYLTARPEVVARLVSTVGILDVNQQGLQLVGVESKEELPESPESFFVEESLPALVAMLADVAEGKDRFEQEMVVQTLQGNRLNVLVSISIPPTLAGFERMLVCVVDLSELKRAEKVLQESMESYESLYRMTPAMLHSLDSDLRILTVSDRWLEEFGYEREEVLGHRISDFQIDESSRYVQEVALPRFLRYGQVFDEPLTFLRKDGTRVDVKLSAVALDRSDDGRFSRAFSILRDPSIEDEARQESPPDYRLFEAAFEHASIGIGFADQEGNPVKCNSALRRMLGFENAEELKERSILDLVPAEERPALQESLLELAEGHTEIYQREGTILGRDDVSLTARLTVSLAGVDTDEVMYTVTLAERARLVGIYPSEHEETVRHLTELRDEISRLSRRLEEKSEKEEVGGA